MKKVSVSGSLRENVGKKDAKRLRREGLVPCVLYGGKDQVMFTASEKAFKDVVYTPEACLVDLDIAGKKFTAILQDIQFHPVSESILHADFLQIFEDKPVKVDIPVKLSGVSPGILKGGKLHMKLRRVKVKGFPGDLPDQIDVTISKLNIGDSFKVGQLASDKLEFIDSPNSVIVMVKSTRVIATVGDDEEEEEGTEGEAPAPAAEE
ncbi:MAG: 50S ribosomal protein L25/general stress protein Ctc [Bacteroidales bacterium]|nr:50S ribosomal protein L25/general stress protein Ctc [Bacteroidales bacterium]